MFRKAFLLILLGVLIVGQASLVSWLRKKEAALVLPARSQMQSWNPESIRVLSLGHVQTISDLLWLRFLQDDSIHHVLPGQHASVFYDLELATSLDPASFLPYYYGAQLLSVIRNDRFGAEKLLLKADQFLKDEYLNHSSSYDEFYWKQAWAIYMTLGYLYLFDFDDMPKAAKAFTESSERPLAPEYLKKLGKRLETVEGQYLTGIRLLGFLAETSPNLELKKEYERKQKNLFVGQYLYQLNQNFREYLIRNPSYRSTQSLSSRQMERFWNLFRRQEKIDDRDPWGGRLRLDSHGKITTTTPHQAAFGLEF